MAAKAKKGKETAGDFKKHLEEIASILEWFDSQEELDVEKALEKVKQAAELIKASKKRLGELENEFEEIKADIEKE
jgi:hypothetical protein